MSDDNAALVVTLKAGTGYDSPWIVVRADNPGEMEQRLAGLDSVISATLEAAGKFAVSNTLGATPVANEPVQQQAPAQPKQAWGSNGGQQQAAPQQRQGGNHPNAQLHPEGRTCAVCPNILEFKKTQSGKPKWQCPDWRWNGGNPNDHTAEFI